MGGEKLLGGVGPLVGNCSTNWEGGPSTVGAGVFSSWIGAILILGLAGLIGCGCCGGLLLFWGCWTALSPGGGWTPGGIATAPSGGMPTRAAFFDARLVGLKVHLKFRPAHREQGNFLSHLVFVFAQLLQAMGVRPADLGIIPLAAGISCWFWSRP